MLKVSSSVSNKHTNDDTLKFIDYIREMPEVWDSRCSAFKMKDIKQQAWKCIALAMDPNYHNLNPTEQNLAVHRCVRKWIHLRGCYTREIRRQKLTWKGRKYMYFDHLAFLNDVVGTASKYAATEHLKIDRYLKKVSLPGELRSGKQEYITEQPDEPPKEILSMDECSSSRLDGDDDDEGHQPVAVITLSDDDDDKSPISIIGTSTINENSQEEIMKSSDSQDDCADEMFLLSLVDDLKRIPNHRKHNIKSKIVYLIQGALEQD